MVAIKMAVESYRQRKTMLWDASKGEGGHRLDRQKGTIMRAAPSVTGACLPESHSAHGVRP